MEQVASEWDRLAHLRSEQIANVDRSFELITDAMLALLPPGVPRTLDAGCGTGEFTERLVSRGLEVTGVDVSGESLAVAEGRLGSHLVRLVHSSVEEFARNHERGMDFDVIVANMVLMDVPKLASFLRAVSRLLSDGGVFLFSVTHPWFWPRYWGYSDQPWFEYNREIFVRAPFRVTGSDPIGSSVHAHRPLSKYVDDLSRAGLALDRLCELTPRHGQHTGVDTPRFLVCRAIRPVGKDE